MYKYSLVLSIALSCLTAGYPTGTTNMDTATSNAPRIPSERLHVEDKTKSKSTEEMSSDDGSTRAITDALPILTSGNAHIVLGTYQAMIAPMPKGSDVMEAIKPIMQIAGNFIPG